MGTGLVSLSVDIVVLAFRGAMGCNGESPGQVRKSKDEGSSKVRVPPASGSQLNLVRTFFSFL